MKKKRASSEHGPGHVTPAGRSVFYDLGFDEAEAIEAFAFACNITSAMRLGHPVFDDDLRLVQSVCLLEKLAQMPQRDGALVRISEGSPSFSGSLIGEYGFRIRRHRSRGLNGVGIVPQSLRFDAQVIRAIGAPGRSKRQSEGPTPRMR